MSTAPIAAHLTDDVLRADLTSAGPGVRRRAEHLLQVPAEVRADIVDEAHTMLNIARGWRPSDTVAHQVDAYRRTGAVPTHYRDMAAAERTHMQGVRCWGA